MMIALTVKESPVYPPVMALPGAMAFALVVVPLGMYWSAVMLAKVARSAVSSRVAIVLKS